MWGPLCGTTPWASAVPLRQQSRKTRISQRLCFDLLGCLACLTVFQKGLYCRASSMAQVPAHMFFRGGWGT